MKIKYATLLTCAAMTCVAQAATMRFIEITSLPGTGSSGAEPNRFHIAEVEAFLTSVTPGAGLDNANDLALAANGATGTTTSGAAFHGADGDLVDGIQSVGAATWTRNTSTVPAVGAVALVDLGGSFDVGTVRVWQRGDSCCQGRLANFTVNFYADNGSGGVGALVDSIAHPTQVATNGFATFNPVPEPSSTALLGLGGLALILRRRK